VRQVLELLARSVPWFCQIIKLNGMECANTTEDGKVANATGKKAIHGKENGKDVEGLLIFAKRGDKIIGREDVLNEFRSKRSEWDGSM
jgi:hypothetical protein